MHRVPLRAMPLALLFLAACGGSTEPKAGRLALGIIAGQGQVVPAGRDSLLNPVVGRLVRQADGSYAFRMLERVGDLLVPPAYAQGGTVVTGSPVPGAVVCAVSVEATAQLTPFTPCTNTDAEGQATFWFQPNTRAGEARAEIRGTLEGAPAVFDTVKATITAGPPRVVGQKGNPDAPIVVQAGAALDLHDLLIVGFDAYNNEIPQAQLPTPQWTLLPFDSTKVLHWQLMEDTSAAPTDSGWVVHPKAGDARLYVWFGTVPTATNRWFLDVKP